MKRRTIIDAKRSLVEKGWITKINRTGVFIPKLYRYADDVVQSGQQKVQDGQHPSFSDNDRIVHSGQQKVQDGQQEVQYGQHKVPFGPTIIEEDSIIEDDSILLGPPHLPERPYLHLLKSF